MINFTVCKTLMVLESITNTALFYI